MGPHGMQERLDVRGDGAGASGEGRAGADRADEVEAGTRGDAAAELARRWVSSIRWAR